MASPNCSAKTSFCAALKIKRIYVDSKPQLVQKLSGLPLTRHLIAEVRFLKTKQDNVGFVEDEQISTDELCHLVFKKEFAQLASFTGKENIGVILVPSTPVSRYPINLFPYEVDKVRNTDDDYLSKKIYQAIRDYQGFKPEMDLLDALKDALVDCNG